MTWLRSSSVGSQSATLRVPLVGGQHVALRAEVVAGERAHGPVEADVGEAHRRADLGEDPVPAVDALLAVRDVVVPQGLVERGQRGGRPRADRAVDHGRHVADGVVEAVVVVAALLLEAPLQPGREVVGRVGGRLRAEQVERDAVVEAEVALDRGDVDPAEGPDVVRVVLLHQLDRALQHPRHAGRAHEHVVRLLLEHEVARPRQRVEAALPQRRQLELAVPVGEVGEEEERQPVRRLLVERAEDAGVVGIARVAQQHLVGLVPPVPAEVAVQEVDHRPQVAALLDVDLEEVAHVVEARRGEAQPALLLDRGRLGVALDDDEAAQVGPVLAGHLRPHGLALVVAVGDGAVGLGLGQEDAPAVVRHLDRAEVGPAVLADRDRGAQEHVRVLVGDRTELPPPLEVAGLPGLEGPLQPAVAGQVDVVRDLGVVVDGGHPVRPSCWS